MKNKTLSVLAALLSVFTFAAPITFAEGGREAAGSLFLPTTGQSMNGQLGDTKTKLMAGVEVAAVATVAILGVAVGGGVVWAGLGPLMANHVWSSVDAYRNAQGKNDPALELQLTDARRAIELSRRRRFEREQSYPSDIRARVLKAGEQEN